MADTNFRDIGGLSLYNGKHIQHGYIYRSGCLTSIPPQKAISVLEKYNIKRILDFRTDKESDVYGKYLPEAISKIQYIRLPIVCENIPLDEKIRLERGWRSYKYLYYHLLTNETAAWKIAFELMSEAKDSPILIHCIAGKDRTGIIIALLLLGMQVRKEEILLDYIKSPGSDESNCHHLFDLVEERGGIVQYFDSIGIDSGLIERIRSFLIN